jgi:hypothetical protein
LVPCINEGYNLTFDLAEIIQIQYEHVVKMMNAFPIIMVNDVVYYVPYQIFEEIEDQSHIFKCEKEMKNEIYLFYILDS